MPSITVSTTVNQPLEITWNAYTQPEHITAWNFASPDWHCPSATNDLRVGGKFTSTMAAKDGSMGFEFGGEYTSVQPLQAFEYSFGDRTAQVRFDVVSSDQTKVTVRFDPETENSEELQRGGWQAILENFKKHAESL
jgi:uncharacterized protein YndB with AHSA1/START domain